MQGVGQARFWVDMCHFPGRKAGCLFDLGQKMMSQSRAEPNLSSSVLKESIVKAF
jgi:hypothetical protein